MGPSFSTDRCAVQQRLGLSGTVNAGRPWAEWRFLAAVGATLERERARWLLWLPVCLAAGIVMYFNLPGEPPGWCGWLAAALGLAGAVAAGQASPSAKAASMPWRHR